MQSLARPLTDIPFKPPAEDQNDFLASMLAAYEKYGPIFRSHLLDGTDVVYLVGPEANRFVLSTNRLKFSHQIGWGKLFGITEAFGNGLLTMDGEEHDHHRRMMTPAFTIAYMDRYLPMMNRIIREHSARWAEQGLVDIYEEMRMVTFDVAAQVLCGLKPGPDVYRLRDLFVQMIMLGLVVASPEDYAENMARLRKELYDLLAPRIAERRQNPTDDVLGMLVQARDEQGQALSDEQLIAHTNILLIAGHETSTSLAAWLFYLLAEHPDYLQRVLDEQAEIFPGDEDPTLETVKRMKVLANAISEAERLYPPVGSGPRGVLEDFEFGGYHVPAGTLVIYSIYASHYLSHIWKDPFTFDPDRFAPPREEDKKESYALVGFGGGPRICLGINFAQVEIKALASIVLRNYRLSVEPNQEIVQFYYGTGKPKNGIKMRVARR